MGCADETISRWSAPRGVLAFPVSVDFIKQIRVTYAQGEDDNGKPRIVLVKTESDCEFKGNEVSFSLTQEETLSFNADEYVEIQVQIYDVNGVPYVGDEVRVRVSDVINEGVAW